MKIGRLSPAVEKHLAFCIESGIHLPFCVIGSPGIGKTEIMKQAIAKVAKGVGKVIHLRMSHPATQTDVDYGGQPALFDAPDGTKIADHVPYEFLRVLRDAKELLIVFIDDLGQAKPAVQAAIMQLVRERTINGHKVSDFVHFVLATNGQSDKAAVTGILRPLQTRMVSVEVEVDANLFINWLGEHYADVPYLKGFCQKRPGYITGEHLTPEQVAGKIGAGYPTPRTIAMVGDMFRMGHDVDILQACITHTVGEGFAKEIIGYRQAYHRIVSMDKVLADPDGAKLPEGIDGNHAQVSAMASLAEKKNFSKVVRYVNRLNHEYIAQFWCIVKETRPDLTETSEYIDFETGGRNEPGF